MYPSLPKAAKCYYGKNGIRERPFEFHATFVQSESSSAREKPRPGQLSRTAFQKTTACTLNIERVQRNDQILTRPLLPQPYRYFSIWALTAHAAHTRPSVTLWHLMPAHHNLKVRQASLSLVYGDAGPLNPQMFVACPSPATEEQLDLICIYSMRFRNSHPEFFGQKGNGKRRDGMVTKQKNPVRNETKRQHVCSPHDGCIDP